MSHLVNRTCSVEIGGKHVKASVLAASGPFFYTSIFQGAVMSAFFWGYMPAQVVGGYLSDQYGGEVILGYAGVVWSLLTLTVPFLHSFPMFFISPTVVIIVTRMCTGLSQGM